MKSILCCKDTGIILKIEKAQLHAMFTAFCSCLNDKTRVKAAQREGEPERSPHDHPQQYVRKGRVGKRGAEKV